MTIDTTSTRSDHDQWHDDWRQWQQDRLTQLTAPFGTASLVSTSWVDEEAQPIDGLPGIWRQQGESVIVHGLTGTGYRLEGGGEPEDGTALTSSDTLTDGTRLVRVFLRDGTPAVRVFDSTAPGLTSIIGLDTFEPDATWRVEAEWRPGAEPQPLVLVDGYTKTSRPDGILVFSLGGVQHELDVREGPDSYAVVFSDTLGGNETYRFRFLSVPLADEDGRTVIDFNRAYLPPCAFSDQYVCPLPSARNRLDVAILAGEKNVQRAEA